MPIDQIRPIGSSDAGDGHSSVMMFAKAVFIHFCFRTLLALPQMTQTDIISSNPLVAASAMAKHVRSSGRNDLYLSKSYAVAHCTLGNTSCDSYCGNLLMFIIG